MAVCVIALPYYIVCAHAHERSGERGETGELRERSEWLDEVKPMREIGLTWSAEASLNANYIWRGLYVGGPSLWAEGSIGWGGLSAGMWWNLGATDWSMQTIHSGTQNAFNPEVDMYVRFSRWGVTLTLMQMYYFDRYTDGQRSRLFDYANHGPGEGGVTSEVRLGYRVSSKLPLSILWCTRFSGRDGYYEDCPGGREECGSEEAHQHLKRAYSTYIEIGYDWHLPKAFDLNARVAITPWRSMYTGFKGDFAVCNINMRVQKNWTINRVSMNAFADLMLNTYNMRKDNILCAGAAMAEQRLNWNVGIGVRM